MAEPLSYSEWVEQKYVLTDQMKESYAQRFIRPIIESGNQPSLAQITYWKSNIPVAEETKWKQLMYSDYLSKFDDQSQAWVFKEVIDCSTYRSFEVKFRSNGLNCTSLETWDDSRVMKYWSDILDVDVYHETGGWGLNENKRLIVLEQPASGDLLTFLNTYAVQLAPNEFAVFEGEGSSASITKIKCNSGETFETWQASANNVDFGKGVARFVYNDMLGKDLLTWNDGFVMQKLDGSYIGKADIANALEMYRFGRTPM